MRIKPPLTQLRRRGTNVLVSDRHGDEHLVADCPDVDAAKLVFGGLHGANVGVPTIEED